MSAPSTTPARALDPDRLKTFAAAPAGYAALLAGAVRPHPLVPLSPRRLLVLALFLPLFVGLQLLNGLGLLLDEVLFPGYRRVKVKAPVFILGVPRSGTTLLHRTLAEDPQFTTFSTWECLFAPSVTARRLILAAERLDRCLGRPLARVLTWAERRLTGALEAIHPTALTAPEEDYLVLTPILACFVLVVPFPFLERAWAMGRFDQLSPTRRRRIMAYYRACLQRHLYVHGGRLLSKNAAFASWAGALDETFPDARFLVCHRPPLETVPSQLHAVAPGLDFFAVPQSPALAERFIAHLEHGYRHLQALFPRDASPRHRRVTMEDLNRDLAATVTYGYRTLGIDLTEPFRRRLEALGRSARRHRPGRGYSLERFGLEAGALRRRFVHACPDRH